MRDRVYIYADEVSKHLARIAGPYGTIDQRIRRAHKALDWPSVRRTKAIWYGEIRRLDAFELIEARAAVESLPLRRTKAPSIARTARPGLIRSA